MNRFFNISAALLFSLLIFSAEVALYGQNPAETALKFNKTSHNFGKISIDSGKQQCSFEFTNCSSQPVVIYNVISSCGCTEPVWTKKPIMPGEGGKIEVTYLNDQGPFPFEKTLTVYTSLSKKPILLRISGVAYENKKSVKELFPVEYGPLGFMKRPLDLGQIEQGSVKSGSTSVANISNKSITVTFADLSDGLFIKINPQIIKAGEIAEITYTVNTSEKENWGNTIYKATPVCNGTKVTKPVKIGCMIIDNISALSKQPGNGSMAMATKSSINLGSVKKGEGITATFTLRNNGDRELVIHKADSNGDKMVIESPERVKPGESFNIVAKADSSTYSGEKIFTITLITNSPKRPLVNLFVMANIVQ